MVTHHVTVKIVDREQGEVRIQPYGYHAVLIGHVDNIPTMQFFTGIFINTQSKKILYAIID